MKITLIGHCTFLIEAEDKKIITDPYFGTRGNIVFKRTQQAAFSRNQLGDIDIILCSHSHWDHFDTKFFKQQKKAISIVPKGTGMLMKALGAPEVKTIRSWEKLDFEGLSIIGTPAVHFAKAIGFILHAEGKTIYFSGDTFYGKWMHRISSMYPLDAACIPVATFRIPMTMGEHTAAKAACTLLPKTVFPMHLDIQPRLPLLRTKQSVNGYRQSLMQQKQLLGLNQLPEVQLLRNGESIEF